MQEERESVSARMTERMQRIIEEVISNHPMYDTKSRFIRESIETKIYDISELISGQKGIRDFLAYLEEDVDWVYRNQYNTDITGKIDKDKDTPVVGNTDINPDKNEILKKCSRSSKLSKSSIIRICMIKNLYDMRDMLNKSNKLKIEERWLFIRSQLLRVKTMLINDLYFALDKEFVESKIESDMEERNLFHIKQHYKRFKNTNGYSYVEDTDKGQELIDILDKVESHI